MKTTLDLLGSGCSGVICSLHSEGMQRRRLLDLGFIPGERVRVLHHSPWGNPIAYGIRGTVIALRKADAKLIQILL